MKNHEHVQIEVDERVIKFFSGQSEDTSFLFEQHNREWWAGFWGYMGIRGNWDQQIEKMQRRGITFNFNDQPK